MASGLQWEGNICRWHGTADVFCFCATAQLRISRWCPSTGESLWAASYSLYLSPPDFCLFPPLGLFWKELFSSSEEATPEMTWVLIQGLTAVTKIAFLKLYKHWKKYVSDIATNFFVINQFLEDIESRDSLKLNFRISQTYFPVKMKKYNQQKVKCLFYINSG